MPLTAGASIRTRTAIWQIKKFAVLPLHHAKQKKNGEQTALFSSAAKLLCFSVAFS